MRAPLGVLVGSALLVVPAASQETRPESYETMAYPPGASAAKIAGTVVIEYSVDSRGAVARAEVVSGHPLLASAAKANVLTWRFAPPSANENVRRRVVYAFELSRQVDYYDPWKEEFQFSGPSSVKVITAPHPTVSAKDCPAKDAKIPGAEVSLRDFVMLSRFGCFGTCPYYEVQVFGDGRVEWSGGRFVEVADRKTYRIATSEAEQLLRRFRTPEVWALCGDYSRRVTDNASVSVKIAAGSANKNIRDYADSAPLWFRQLQVEINRVADTHTLRHGAAETEALIHIREEYLPKPGITDLMRATVRGDLALAKQALDAGAVVDATDSSGWTALMYAAASYGNRKILEELLRRRANPEQVSPFGDTVLMAASLRGSFDPALARLGNNINAQNRDGVSALMLIASRGRYEEIEAALNAGADPNLRDKQGHTALNYLEARNCRRSLVS